jgi:hypothetical protein
MKKQRLLYPSHAIRNETVLIHSNTHVHKRISRWLLWSSQTTNKQHTQPTRNDTKGGSRPPPPSVSFKCVRWNIRAHKWKNSDVFAYLAPPGMRQRPLSNIHAHKCIKKRFLRSSQSIHQKWYKGEGPTPLLALQYHLKVCDCAAVFACVNERWAKTLKDTQLAKESQDPTSRGWLA